MFENLFTLSKLGLFWNCLKCYLFCGLPLVKFGKAVVATFQVNVCVGVWGGYMGKSTSGCLVYVKNGLRDCLESPKKWSDFDKEDCLLHDTGVLQAIWFEHCKANGILCLQLQSEMEWEFIWCFPIWGKRTK